MNLAGVMEQGRLRLAEGGDGAVRQAPHNVLRGASLSRSPAEAFLMRGAGPSRSPAEGSNLQRGQRVLPKGALRRTMAQFRSSLRHCRSASASQPSAASEALGEWDLISGSLSWADLPNAARDCGISASKLGGG